MSFIRILPENLANQIAAGEVVERPASVVKELLENAIDAGACGISVQIENGGTGLIRVIDDGCGMDEDDILLSLERHATSKLTRLDQLAAITTLGFRGEAIPSIASVSKMTITSRTASAQLGSRVEVRFGKIVKVHAMGAAPGTVIEVKNLFGNVPARRKFLKSTATEIAHIDEVIRSYALANHRRGFALRINERQIFDWPVDSNEAARVARVMGGAARLIHFSGSDAAIGAAHGYLPAPDPQLLKSARLWLFVNGRSVKDRVISHAVSEGMRGFLMKGRRAAGVIFLKIPPDQVDVNVHPAKQEVRFRKANLVHKLVEESVRQAMLDLQKQRKKDLFGIAGDGETAPGPLAGYTAPEPAPTYSRQSTALQVTA
ncbi:MAG: DNA mismatch repair endonuclease MutL, partial [Deltaproteobacteria bacterium]|nr:DNA mismatch repair endonuclease MutL [Deltaproteobacteria bacterium]